MFYKEHVERKKSLMSKKRQGFLKSKRIIALILSFSIWGLSFLSAIGVKTYAEGDNPQYNYSVEIYFGSLSFYYDYGIWDVNSLTYVSNTSSKNPAKDTMDGSPGWYGFDGVANKISVQYAGYEDTKIEVTISYANTGNISGVVMQGYEAGDFTTRIGNTDNQYTFDVVHLEDIVDTYLSFKGKPTEAGQPLYSESGFKQIGLLTLSISEVMDIDD